MNKKLIFFLLIFCAIISGACSKRENGKLVSEKSSAFGNAKNYVPNGFTYEKTLIESGFKKLGIEGNYEIVIADNPDIVENTAAEELRKYLIKGGLNVKIVPESISAGKKRFLLGRDSNMKSISRFGDSGDLKIRDVSAEDDGFDLKRIGVDVFVAGANPRGVLYGVYAFEDFITAGANGILDIRKIPYFRKRGSGPVYFFNRINIFTEDFPEEKAACLSRLGINQLTDQGVGGGLNDFVSSDVFQFQKPPRADFQRKVRAMSALCKKYGIDQYIFISEPVLASIAGDLKKYPKEALGTVKRPWGGDKDGKDKTLCVSSPIVQKHLRNMMRKFVREYPDIKGVQFYNMDGSTWLCTPELCDRCKAICKDSPQDEFNPWETQAKFVTLLAEAAHEENPGFEFKLWGSIHFHGEGFKKMIHAARGYDGLLSTWNASDRSVMVPDAAEPDPACILSQKICRERGIPFYMMCELNNHDIVPQSLPFPFHVCDALKKFKQWDVKYLTEIFGMIPEHNTINSIVTKEFQWNPDQNPGEFLTDLSRRQFGEAGGKLMYQAWEEIEKAFDTWNDIKSGPFPLEGSQFQLSMGIENGGLPRPILPDIVKWYNDMNGVLTNVEPWLADGYQKYKEQAFLDKMLLMNFHLTKAAGLARESIAAASDREFIGICYYEAVTGRPTCKEYAELNYASIAMADAICRQRCDMLRAYHLLTDIEKARAATDEKSAKAKGKLYLELIREDIGVQEHFCELLTGFEKMRPCYLRTSMTEHEISDLLLTTRTKIDILKGFLENKKPSDFINMPGYGGNRSSY